MASYSPKTSTQGIDKSSGEDDAGYQFTRDGCGSGSEAAAVASGSLTFVIMRPVSLEQVAAPPVPITRPYHCPLSSYRPPRFHQAHAVMHHS